MQTSCPSTFTKIESFASNSLICCWDRDVTTAFTLFIILPNFFPIVRKLHLTFLTRMTSSPSMNVKCFTLVSARMTSLKRSIRWRMVLSVAGMEIALRTCITGIFTFFLNDSTMVVTCIASFIASSSSESTYSSCITGKSARCTLSELSFPVTALRSRNRRSA